MTTAGHPSIEMPAAAEAPERTLRGPPLAAASWIGARTLGGFLAEVTQRFAPNQAIAYRDRRTGQELRWSYADLRREVRRAARACLAAGVGKGTQLGLWLPSRPEFVALFYGAAMIGAVVVPLSTLAARRELDFLLRHPDLALLFTQSALLRRSFAEDLFALCPELASAEPGQLLEARFPYLRRVVMLDTETASGAVETWESFIARGDRISDAVLDAAAQQVHESDPAVIVYSSGTTAEPKGILYAQRAPAIQSWNMGQLFRRDESVRMWTPFPLFWSAGIATAMGGVFATGGCFVMQETFDPAEAIELIARERVTEPYVTRGHQSAAMEELPGWRAADFSSVRQAGGKAAFLRHPSVTTPDPAWTQPTGFGMSESCAIFAAHAADVPSDARGGSHGRLLPGNALRILDPETGRVLCAREAGEIAIRGPTLMERYVKKNREECFDAEGFFRTGDGGWFDESGQLHWTGRLTDLIRTSGANVSPAEVELVLRDCRPLKAARIVAVPDPVRGEVVVLCATLKQNETISAEELRAWCRERLASYKVPRFVLLLAENEMPMTANQKIRDDQLRALARARLRIEPAAGGGE